MARRFTRHRTLLLLLLCTILAIMLVSALLYQIGMNYLEGKPRTFLEALEFASETLTTTGYGRDANWTHPLMVTFVVVLQYVGVFIVFLVVPIYLIPYLEARFEMRLPKEAKDMKDHVVIYHYAPSVTTLLEELKADKVPCVVLEEDETLARQVIRDGHNVVHGGLGDKSLRSVNILRARALIANGTDDRNAAFCLVARQLGFEREIYAMVEDPYHRKPLALAGASAVFTPRHMLGAALAAHASSRISPRISGFQQIGQQLELAEMRVYPDSELVGKSLVESAIGSRTRVHVMARWVSGILDADMKGSKIIEANDILVVVGAETGIAELACLLGGDALRRKGQFLVAGFGEVGRKVHELLMAVGEDVAVIDRVASEDVTFVGDVLDHNLLKSVDLKSAQAVILALDSDSATLFATVVIKDLAPDIRIIARVNHPDNLERLYRAGAEFALSISQVAGQILARRLLGEDSISLNPELKLQNFSAARLAGFGLAELRIREQFGCSVVAVERDDDVIVSLDADFKFLAGDRVYVCGSPARIQQFEDHFDS
ncbi:MAG: TrkA family potassium uptake protein [Acidobacteria bacterium]|nr:TrkA family potassium uptake protein [Acidobacteriota bacterium]